MKTSTEAGPESKSAPDGARDLLQAIALRAHTVREQAMSGLPSPCDDATTAALTSLLERLKTCDRDLLWVYFRRQEPAGSAPPIDHISSGFERMRIEHGEAKALREVIDHMRDVSEVARDSELFRRLSALLGGYAGELGDDPMCLCPCGPCERVPCIFDSAPEADTRPGKPGISPPIIPAPGDGRRITVVKFTCDCVHCGLSFPTDEDFHAHECNPSHREDAGSTRNGVRE